MIQKFESLNIVDLVPTGGAQQLFINSSPLQSMVARLALEYVSNAQDKKRALKELLSQIKGFKEEERRSYLDACVSSSADPKDQYVLKKIVELVPLPSVVRLFTKYLQLAHEKNAGARSSWGSSNSYQRSILDTMCAHHYRSALTLLEKTDDPRGQKTLVKLLLRIMNKDAKQDLKNPKESLSSENVDEILGVLVKKEKLPLALVDKIIDALPLRSVDSSYGFWSSAPRKNYMPSRICSASGAFTPIKTQPHVMVSLLERGASCSVLKYVKQGKSVIGTHVWESALLHASKADIEALAEQMSQEVQDRYSSQSDQRTIDRELLDTYLENAGFFGRKSKGLSLKAGGAHLLFEALWSNDMSVLERIGTADLWVRKALLHPAAPLADSGSAVGAFSSCLQLAALMGSDTLLAFLLKEHEKNGVQKKLNKEKGVGVKKTDLQTEQCKKSFEAAIAASKKPTSLQQALAQDRSSILFLDDFAPTSPKGIVVHYYEKNQKGAPSDPFAAPTLSSDRASCSWVLSGTPDMGSGVHFTKERSVEKNSANPIVCTLMDCALLSQSVGVLTVLRDHLGVKKFEAQSQKSLEYLRQSGVSEEKMEQLQSLVQHCNAPVVKKSKVAL